jgi:hypothetical protein
MTTYPSQIDTSVSLPIVIDNETPVEASDLNNLRTTIIAIENELGVQPSSTYSTVKARLDSLTSTASNCIQMGGDIDAGTLISPIVTGIMGTPINPSISISSLLNRQVLMWDGAYWSPYSLFSMFSGDLQGIGITQKVIGLQGRSLASDTPIFGEAIVYNGSGWQPLQIAQDYILPPFNIEFSATVNLYEVSYTVNNPVFSGTFGGNYSFEALTGSVNDGTNIYNVSSYLSSSPYTFSITNSYQKTEFYNPSTGDGYVNFTMTATKAGIIKVLESTIYWGQKNYYGNSVVPVPVPESYDQNFIKNLASTSTGGSLLSLTRSMDLQVTAGTSEAIYYACRTDYGVPLFYVGGFEGGFSPVAIVPLTNSSGFSENYTLYKSDNLGLGSITISVV